MATQRLEPVERRRLCVVEAVLAHRLDVREAATALGLSERQVYRLCARVRREGSAGLVHGNRGRSPLNKIDERVWQTALELARDRYAGSSVAQLQRALARLHGIEVGRESLRKRLRAAGIPSPRVPRPAADTRPPRG